MMRYLNLDASTAAAPNENYARELMELFTLGPGNYTEDDVREGARALSGLRIALFDASGQRVAAPKDAKANPQAYQTGDQRARAVGRASSAARWCRACTTPASKTFLGHTGNLGADDVIDIILAQPACAPFVTRRAMTFFATPSPSAADVNAVATQFRDIQVRHPHPDARHLPQQRVHRAVQLPIAAALAHRLHGGGDARARTARSSSRSRCAPPPGWTRCCTTRPTSPAGRRTPAGSARRRCWRGSTSPPSPTTRPAGLPDPTAAVATQLDGVLGKDTTAALRAAHTDADRWFALLAGPEFHLK